MALRRTMVRPVASMSGSTMTMPATTMTAEAGGGHREQPNGAQNKADQIDTHGANEANAKARYPFCAG